MDRENNTGADVFSIQYMEAYTDMNNWVQMAFTDRKKQESY